MRNILLVIKYEFIAILSKRSFWLTTFFLPAMILTVTFGSQLFFRDSLDEPSESELISSGDLEIGLVDLSGLIQNIPEDYQLIVFPDQAGASSALEQGNIDKYYLLQEDALETGTIFLIVKDYAPLKEMGSSAYFLPLLKYNLAPELETALLLEQPLQNLVFQELESESQLRNTGQTKLTEMLPYMFLIVFFMLISVSGSLMLTSVTQEKENRTVEILLLSLRPIELMAGKLLGLTLVALLQIGIWAIAIPNGLNSANSYFELAGGMQIPASLFYWGIPFVFLGFLMYASAQGALGALAPTAREGTQYTFLVMLPLFIPMILNGLFVEAPGGGLVTFLSLFPLTAPISMVARMSAVLVPVWQTVLSLIGVLLFTMLFILLSAQLFRADTLLSTGSLNISRLWKEFGKAFKSAFTRA